jgi:hypothetical protein
MLALRQDWLGVSRSFAWHMVLLFVLVFISRLLFLNAGYGANVDAWRVARAAYDIATTGEYSTSLVSFGGRIHCKFQIFVPILHLATHHREVALDSVKPSDAWEQSPTFESELFE